MTTTILKDKNQGYKDTLYTRSEENRYGMSMLDVLINYLSCIDTVNDSQTAPEFKRFKAYIKGHLGHELTLQEERNLAEGTMRFLYSGSETNERSEAIEFIIELHFLID